MPNIDVNQERIADESPSVARSGIVSMPGCRVSGGSEHMLSPRSTWQQLRYSVQISPHPNEDLVRSYRRSVMARMIPLVGESIGDKIAQRALNN